MKGDQGTMPESDIEVAAEWLYRRYVRERYGCLYVRWNELPGRTKAEYRRDAKRLLETLDCFRQYKQRKQREERAAPMVYDVDTREIRDQLGAARA